METYEGNHADFYESNAQSGDENLLVKFYIKPRLDSSRAHEGRPVYIDTEYVDIRVPGSRDSVARPASAHDKQRFAKHYAAFKQRIELPETGTPLAQWPPMTRSMVEELAFLNIKTVEQLAACPDTNAQKIMGLQHFKHLANQYLRAAAADAPLDQLNAELEARDNKIEQQERLIQDLSARLDALEKSEDAPAAAAPVEPAPQPAPEVTFGSALDRAPEPEPAATGEVITSEAPKVRRRRRKPVSEE